MNEAWDSHAALAALAWQLEAGVSEVICDTPVDRFAVDPPTDQPAQTTVPAPGGDAPRRAPKPRIAAAPDIDPVAEAASLARRCGDLETLRATLGAFDHCALKQGARQLVFSDGNPAADVMILGEAPGRECDREGRPFCGPEGALLDRMLAAIDLDRGHADAGGVYLSNVLPWRPPQNRDPSPQEIAMMLPFVAQHIALVKPKVLVLMGNIACQAGLGARGILRMRGQWATAFDLPALPMVHPAYLLRTPAAKREAWADLLALRAHLNERVLH